ncbi:MAG: aspartate 1-decarboxylase [Nitrospirae bacterium]|nr:aspartate 1-decarboxylase [Nitrospirota bacterium]
MLRCMLRCKVHRATVTESNLEYEGSLTLDSLLMEKAGMLPYEQVLISNLNNGERFGTYVIPGEYGSGVVCLNGPTARKGVPGDRVIIFCYEYLTDDELKDYQPAIIKVDGSNHITEVVRDSYSSGKRL